MSVVIAEKCVENAIGLSFELARMDEASIGNGDNAYIRGFDGRDAASASSITRHAAARRI